MPDLRQRVQQQFGAHAERYVTSPDHARGESLERLRALVRPRPDWRMLDVATGGGHTALAFAPRVREVAALDLTAEMLAAAARFVSSRGAANVSFQQADALTLPFGQSSFDLVTCRIAPHHFPDCGQFVREVARVLKPLGLAALVDNVVPDSPNAARHINALEKLRDPGHHWAYTPADWLGFFEASGLQVMHTETLRKARDLDHWAGMMSVDEETKTKLRVMLHHAPAAAREALAPEFAGEKVTFYLTEILIVARRASG